MFLRTILTLITFFSFSLSYALPSTPDEYVELFKSGLEVEKEKAVQTLAWAGISSPQLFDLIEKEVLDRYASTTDRNKVDVNYLSWLAKGLSFSGNMKYEATLNKVINEASSSKVKKYAKIALAQLPNYTVYNSLIAPKSWPDAEHPTEAERFHNMLKSDNTELLRIAAKRVHYSHNYDDAFLKEIDSAITQNYTKSMTADRADAIAWLCKALAGSRVQTYKPTIENVAKNAKEKKIRAYAKKYLKYYSK